MIHWLTQSRSPTHEGDGGGGCVEGDEDDNDDDRMKTNRKVIELEKKLRVTRLKEERTIEMFILSNVEACLAIDDATLDLDGSPFSFP